MDNYKFEVQTKQLILKYILQYFDTLIDSTQL